MIINFIGPPGSGKTTQLNILKDNLSTITKLQHISVPLLLKNTDQFLDYLTPENMLVINSVLKEANNAREIGILAPICLDEILFSVAEKMLIDNNMVLIDGAPRGIEQANLFIRKGMVKKCVIIEFFFPEKVLEHSISRQFGRQLLKDGLLIAEQRIEKFKNKYDVYKNETSKALSLLKENGVIYFEVNALDPKEIISLEISSTISKSEFYTMNGNIKSHIPMMIYR